MKKFTLIVGIIVLSAVFAMAQEKPHFSGGIYVGVNGCQIDGDRYVGYNHGGLDVAATAQVPVSRYFFFSLELAYSQKGAQDKFTEATGNLYKININYIDVPVLLHFYDRKKIGLYGGMQFSRLIGSFHETINTLYNPNYNYQGITAVYNNDYEGVLGVTYYIIPAIPFDIRFCYSVTSFGFSPESLYRYGKIFNNLFQFRLGYIFGQDFDADRKEKWIKGL